MTQRPGFGFAARMAACFLGLLPLPVVAHAQAEPADPAEPIPAAVSETEPGLSDPPATTPAATTPTAATPAAIAPAAIDVAGASIAPEKRSFADVTRSFFSDGAYLFTFPTRTTPRGVAMTAGWGAGLLATLHYDDRIFEEVAGQEEPGRDGTAQMIEPLGRMPVQAGVLGLLYVGARAADRPGLASTAATSFEALLWAGLIGNTGKMLFGRQQPSSTMDARYFFDGQGSFPSGHAARSFAVAAVMADRYGARGAWIGYSIAGAVSLAMVQREIHWASDIVAGAGLGLAIGKGIAARHPDPTREAGLGPKSARRVAWLVQPARDGASLSLSF